MTATSRTGAASTPLLAAPAVSGPRAATPDTWLDPRGLLLGRYNRVVVVEVWTVVSPLIGVCALVALGALSGWFAAAAARKHPARTRTTPLAPPKAELAPVEDPLSEAEQRELVLALLERQALFEKWGIIDARFCYRGGHRRTAESVRAETAAIQAELEREAGE